MDTQGKGARTPLPSELDHQCCFPLSSDDMIMHPNEPVSQMMLSPQLRVTLNILFNKKLKKERERVRDKVSSLGLYQGNMRERAMRDRMARETDRN